ncbi:kinesin light chain [Rhizoctonia solani]|uniref:Kinesin light chain n=1 Tax=Rhizoctonia solani TaxID=456999 RepID=A0A8H8NZP5_9AGAM|nr:kinesin light chain [Rhizoctonia solani]QRW21291.1 kinesin light chain [Rhizoctonia solani]
MLKMRELELKCEPLIPADHFDYIAGSGAGGISACMLGRLRTPIDKAIEEYVKLMKSIFLEKKLSVSRAVYKAKNLQEALGAMIREATGNKEEMMIGREGLPKILERGVGKTQLVLNVIERTGDKWDYVIYVDASSERSIKEALQDFVIINHVGESHEDAIGWLEHIPNQWLLVLDNADDRSLVTGIRRYIPRGLHGNVIITTRLVDMAIVAKGVNSTCHLSCMDQEDGSALLLKTARMEDHGLSAADREAAVALLQPMYTRKDLGYHALAIVHAGAYIRHVHSVGVVKYRDLFLSECHATLNDSGTFYRKIEQYAKSLDTTWKLCYELLQEPPK